jgi:hypothetical protein
MDGALVLPDGRQLIHASVRTQSGHGFPIHLVAVDGTVEKSFGSATGELIPQCPHCFLRRIALDNDSASVWSMPVHRYQLERWSFDGTRSQVISNANSRWFHEWQPVPAVRGAPAPKAPVSSLPNIWTTIEQVVARGDNALLIRGTVPDPSVSALLPNGRALEPITSAAEARERIANPSPVQWFPSRATVVDLFDLERSEVVATGKWPGMEIELMDHNYAYVRREDQDGRVLIDIWRIVVVVSSTPANSSHRFP